MKIQQVEELVGITKKNIRFYEQEGLLNPARSENGYRDYSEADVQVLKKIKLLRSLSFPLEEIRMMLNGALTMEDGARRHIIALERSQASLEKARSLCIELQEHQETLLTLDTEYYLQKMEVMEKEGVVFMNLQKQDHKKAFIAPVIAASVVILFMAAILFIMISEIMTEPLSIGLILLIAITVLLLLGVIIGVISALLQRFKQIEGGEEDAAAKY